MSAQDRANAAKGMAEWTEEEKIDAAGKVYEAVTSRAEMWARKDAIIAAHNENAIRLQCEVTALRGALEQLQAAVLTEGLERTSDEEDKRGAINFLGLMDAMKQSREILTHAAKKTEIMMMSDKTADPNIEATLRALSPDIYAARDGIWWASLYLGTTWKDAIRHTYVRNYMKLNPEAKLPAVE
jgi:DNA polymerase III delta prime subunit